MEKKRRSCVRIWLWILAAAVLACAASVYISYQVLTVSRYPLHSDKLSAGVRLVLLTDLHNNTFGKGNTRLVETVRREDPDLIVLCGDLVNQGEADTSVAEEFIRSLSAIAPVYASYGNHERTHQRNFGSDFTALYTAAGATMLESEWTDLTVNGQRLRLGGVYGFCLPEEALGPGDVLGPEAGFLRQMQDTDALTVLLCHFPLAWIAYGGLEGWDLDVVLSGHAHGGQVRLPWIGGLYAPDQGWFPGREAGAYLSRDGERAMVLSQGLGSDWVGIPRFNNPCEVVTVDLLP